MTNSRSPDRKRPSSRLGLVPFTLVVAAGLAVFLAVQNPAVLMGSSSMAGQIVTVDRAAVKKGLADQSIILVDVREPDEYSAGHIPGAKLYPMSTFNPAALPKADAGKKVVIYCRSGKRAQDAVSKAQAAGRTDITDVYVGSMNDWAGAGEAVTKGAAP